MVAKRMNQTKANARKKAPAKRTNPSARSQRAQALRMLSQAINEITGRPVVSKGGSVSGSGRKMGR